MAKLAELDENDYKDSTLIMELLRENLILWKMNVGDEDALSGKDDNHTTEGDVKKEEEKDVEIGSGQKEEGEKIESVKDEEKMEIAQDSTKDGKLLDVNMEVTKEAEGA